MRVDPEFQARASGLSLATAEILYYLPDHPSLLQTFLWQTLDSAPEFPRLSRFLDFWRREIEAVIHSVSVACEGGLQPARWSKVDGLYRLT